MVRIFLGFTKFYRKFIKNFSKRITIVFTLIIWINNNSLNISFYNNRINNSKYKKRNSIDDISSNEIICRDIKNMSKIIKSKVLAKSQKVKFD